MTGNRLILSEALQATAALVGGLKDGEPLQVAFYHWVLSVGFPPDRRARLAKELQATISSGGRSIQSVGALGYLLATSPPLSDPYPSVFKQGVEWLSGRTGGSHDGFAALLQPVAQLGLLAGLVATREAQLFSTFAEWFDALLKRPRSARQSDADWREELLQQIHSRLSVGLSGDANLQMDSSAAVFAARGLASLGNTEAGAFASELLGRLKALNYTDPEQAALDLVAYQYLARADVDVDLRAPSLNDVALVLQRVPAALRRWTWEKEKKTPNSTAQKWAVENEYHFQNLLYALLAPVFHEIQDEEWLSSVGQKKPRADLVMPSLHLVLEVKYWRASHSPQELISQIAEDVSLYLKAGSPYRHVLPVIWDQGRRTEEHDYLIAGLKAIRDVVSPVVIPQPGFMN